MSATAAAPRGRRFLVAIGVGLAVLGVALQTALYLLNVYALDRRVELFELEEGGLVTWATSSVTFAAATLALVVGCILGQQLLRSSLLAAGLVFVSMDDALYIHERMAFWLADHYDFSTSLVQVVWPPIYLPLLAAIAVLLLRLVEGAGDARRLTLAGLGALAGAVALEVASHGLTRIGVGDDTWPWVAEISIEEGAELAGWALVATGLGVLLIDAVEQASPPVASHDAQ